VRTIEDWLAVVLGDFSGTPVADVDVRLVRLDPARLDEVAATLPDAATWIAPGDPTARRLLLRVGTNVTSLDQVADAPAAFAVEVASYLQDVVMDELNRPWPEVPARDGRSTVLEPRLGPEGMPEWAGRGVVREFGRLDG
jgi:hypothetical protein